MSTRALVAFFALSLFAAAAACPRNCGSDKICVSWRGIISRCVPKPKPNPACSCITLFKPVCCAVSVKRGWFFVWKGTFQASNACQCGCRSGKVCSGSVAPPKAACTKERIPVCCKVGIKAPETAPNKCVCTERRGGTIISQGECVTAPKPPVKPPTDVVCPAVFNPVCCSIPGKDAPETASNACVCTGQKLGIVEAAGECASSTEPVICPQVFEPVCCLGEGATKPTTVSNKCTCGKGTVVPDTRCPPVGTDPPAGNPGGAVACTQQFEPVCCKMPGKTSPETASNECVCTKQKLGTVESTGECTAATVPIGPVGPICPQIFAPVCCLPEGSTTSVTKGNKCECGTGRVVMEGACLSKDLKK